LRWSALSTRISGASAGDQPRYGRDVKGRTVLHQSSERPREASHAEHDRTARPIGWVESDSISSVGSPEGEGVRHRSGANGDSESGGKSRLVNVTGRMAGSIRRVSYMADAEKTRPYTRARGRPHGPADGRGRTCPGTGPHAWARAPPFPPGGWPKGDAPTPRTPPSLPSSAHSRTSQLSINLRLASALIAGRRPLRTTPFKAKRATRCMRPSGDGTGISSSATNGMGGSRSGAVGRLSPSSFRSASWAYRPRMAKERSRGTSDCGEMGGTFLMRGVLREGASEP